MADSYNGPVRIFGDDGVLLTTGVAALETDIEMRSWTGVVQTLSGSAVAGKALIVEIETTDGAKGRAQLTPQGTVAERSSSRVAGLGAQPF